MQLFQFDTVFVRFPEFLAFSFSIYLSNHVIKKRIGSRRSRSKQKDDSTRPVPPLLLGTLQIGTFCEWAEEKNKQIWKKRGKMIANKGNVIRVRSLFFHKKKYEHWIIILDLAVQQPEIFCYKYNMGVYTPRTEHFICVICYGFVKSIRGSSGLNIVWIHFKIALIITAVSSIEFFFLRSLLSFPQRARNREQARERERERTLRIRKGSYGYCCIMELITNNDLIVPFKYWFFSFFLVQLSAFCNISDRNCEKRNYTEKRRTNRSRLERMKLLNA